MPFKFDKYKASEFQPRTADVKVPELKDWFDDGDEPIWRVRALTAVELAKVREAVERNAAGLKTLVESLVYAQDDAKNAVGKDIKRRMDDQVPGDIVRRYEILMAGSVDPEVKEKSDAITLGVNHPGTLYELTNKILELTGQGATPGKQKPCGGTKGSGRA